MSINSDWDKNTPPGVDAKDDGGHAGQVEWTLVRLPPSEIVEWISKVKTSKSLSPPESLGVIIMVEYVGQHHIAVLLATRAPRPFDSKTYWHARRIHYFASERREREFLLSIYIQNTRKSFIMSGNFFHRSVKKDTNFPVANSSATLTLEPIALWILTHNF